MLKMLGLSILASLHIACRSTGHLNDESDLESGPSPFPSTIAGVQLNGAHVVVAGRDKPLVIRSQAPHEEREYNDLIKLGVTDVIIFKKEINHEVHDELEEFKTRGLKPKRLTHIPMRYRDFENFEEPCQYTIEALKAVRSAMNADGRMALIHCTMGEDRTGFLSGLVKLLETNGDVKDIFKNELCKNGYSTGNRKKPKDVTDAIDRDLTPVFARMAYLIKSKRLSWKTLNADELCASDPFDSQMDAGTKRAFDPNKLRCDAL